ncbi:MAG TPA: hypothetical protein VFN55_17675 [Solirubrobacteraceae bacterium]|nr:hypothetical protein [Solirubrobacteraceae bacterium]
MPAPRRIELEELVNRPGTYLNPLTEVLVIVDDSSALDTEALDLEASDGDDWVLVSDEVPVDEHQRDALLERFTIRHHDAGLHTGDDELVEDEEELEPDLDPEE